MKKNIIFLIVLLFVMITGWSQNEKIVKFYDTKPGSGYYNIGTDFAYIGDSIMIFQMWSNEAGYELWRTNGTAEGTYMVKDIDPSLDPYDSPNSSFPDYFHTYNDKVYFRATDGKQGFELWCTDGTEAGTKMVKDIYEGSRGALNPSSPDFCVYNNQLYFQATGSTSLGHELWKTDGTADGTVLVKDILSEDEKSSYPENFIVFNNLLFFTAKTNYKSNIYRTEIWYTDGSSEGTLRLSHLPADQTPETDELLVFNGLLIFKGNLNHGLELWKTDGTSDGTMEIKDINPGTAWGAPGEDEMVELNGELYFVGKTAELGTELWKTDGTEVGTVLVKDINPGMDGNTPYSSTPTFLCSFDNKVFFAARNEDSGTQLWASDGTTNGTLLYYGSHVNGTWNPRNLINFNNRFYFTLNTSAYGEPYLYSMGSSTETPLALQPLDFTFMKYNRVYSNFFTLKNTLYFQADLEANTGYELYKLVKGEPECALEKLPKPTGPTETCANINYDLYRTENSTTNATINWVLEPDTAGTLSGTGNVIQITWDSSFIGNVKLWAYLSENDCTGAVSDTLSIKRFEMPDKPIITQNNDSLVSTFASSYQWYKRIFESEQGGDYLEPLEGATNQVYSPIENGIFAVQIANEGGCTSLSEDFSYVNLGLRENQQLKFTIFPNPNNGEFSFQLKDELLGGKIIVKDILGKTIKIQKLSKDQNTVSLDVSPGIYFISYNLNNKYYGLQKMIVE